jgi:hypothetical protein
MGIQTSFLGLFRGLCRITFSNTEVPAECQSFGRAEPENSEHTELMEFPIGRLGDEMIETVFSSTAPKAIFICD